MKTTVQIAVTIVLTTMFLACSVAAQRTERGLSCDNNWSGWRKGEGHCEIKEQTLPATGGVIKVDGKRNGGVTVKGWDRNEILVRAQVSAHADTTDDARALTNQVRIETGGANIYADGPESRDNRWWAVSFEVFVPRQSNLTLKAYNGGISIDSVRGTMEFDTNNGGVSLRDVNGNVKGRTRNGGLSVKLSGNRWEGEGLDVQTTNGGVQLAIPENYSAHLETGTVNGGVISAFLSRYKAKLKRIFPNSLNRF